MCLKTKPKVCGNSYKVVLCDCQYTDSKLLISFLLLSQYQEESVPRSTINTENSDVLSSRHITEESQVVDSQLLPTSGYGEENVCVKF